MVAIGSAKNKRLWLIYISGFFVAVHYATIVYLNSSLLSQFAGKNTVNLLYVISSVLSIVFLAIAPILVRSRGSIFTFLLFIFLEIISVFGMGSFNLAFVIMALFIVHQAAESMLNFCLDLNLEQETRAEGTTGGKRGTLLMVQNVAWVLSPLTISILVANGSFRPMYILSGIALIPLTLIIATFFTNTKKAEVREAKILPVIKSFSHSLFQSNLTNFTPVGWLI